MKNIIHNLYVYRKEFKNTDTKHLQKLYSKCTFGLTPVTEWLEKVEIQTGQPMHGAPDRQCFCQSYTKLYRRRP